MTEQGSYVGLKTESKSNHCYFSMHTHSTVFTTTHYGQNKKKTVHTKHKTNFTNERDGVGKKKQNYKTFRDHVYEMP